MVIENNTEDIKVDKDEENQKKILKFYYATN